MHPLNEKTGTVGLRCLVEAPKERVFRAWTDPNELLGWWDNLTEAETDLQKGGAFRLGWKMPGSPKLDVTTGEYREVHPPDRLVCTWSAGGGAETLVAVDFLERQKGTEVMLIHEGLPPGGVTEAYRKGWKEALEGLRKHLKGPS